jgi:hypothetical protein
MLKTQKITNKKTGEIVFAVNNDTGGVLSVHNTARQAKAALKFALQNSKLAEYWSGSVSGSLLQKYSSGDYTVITV